MPEETWTKSGFDALTELEELELVIAREGRETLRFPVWVVTAEGGVYLRSYKGASSMWFRRVQANADQAIVLDGADVPVRFENVDRHDEVNKAISAEFDRKYARFNYVGEMSEPAAVEATVRIVPR